MVACARRLGTRNVRRVSDRHYGNNVHRNRCIFPSNTSFREPSLFAQSGRHRGQYRRHADSE